MLGQFDGQLLRNYFQKFFAGRNDNRLSHLVMFCLGKHVLDDPFRVSAIIRYNHHFGWPCDHIDADLTKHHFLGSRHIDITRSDNLVDFRYSFSSKCHRRNCLSPAQGKYLLNTTKMRGSQERWIKFTTRGGNTKNHLIHTSNLSRNRSHYYRRRVRCFAAGSIDAYPRHRSNILPKMITHVIGVTPPVAGDH